MDNADIVKSLEYYEGLNLVDFCPFQYGNQSFKDAAEYILSSFSNEINIYPCSNNQVIAVVDANLSCYLELS